MLLSRGESGHSRVCVDSFTYMPHTMNMLQPLVWIYLSQFQPIGFLAKWSKFIIQTSTFYI